MKPKFKLGIIGGVGWLGTAMAKPLLGSGSLPREQLGASFRSKKPADWPGAFLSQDNQALADWADVIIVSVRPQDWRGLQVDAKGKLVLSVMAGITIKDLSKHFQTLRVVRMLPNAAAAYGQSYTPWIASAEVTDTDRQTVRLILEPSGVADEIHREQDIDYFTGMTGSGPAFPALLAHAMCNDAIQRGIEPAIACRAAIQVLIGAGSYFADTHKLPNEVVKEFLDYRGTTAAAIEAMCKLGLENAVREGLGAAFRKSLNMGESG